MKHTHTTLAGDRFIHASADRRRWSRSNRSRRDIATNFLTASAALLGVIGILGAVAFFSK